MQITVKISEVKRGEFMNEDVIILLLIIWAALPLGLIPAVIILATKNSRLKKLLEANGVDIANASVPEKQRKLEAGPGIFEEILEDDPHQLPVYLGPVHPQFRLLEFGYAQCAGEHFRHLYAL